MSQIVTRTRDEVYHLWVQALRSGKYEQATGQLRTVEYDYTGDEIKIKRATGFCCLGVLCDLAVKDGGPEWDNDSDFCRGIYSDDGEPPENFRKFMELDDDMVAHLIKMNDDDGATFDEIADEIEFNIMPALDVK